MGREMTVWPNEVMCLTEREDALAQLIGKAAQIRPSTGRERDDAGKDGKDVLDPVAQLLCHQFTLLGDAAGLVNIGASADPAQDFARSIPNGKRPPQRPAIFTAVVPQAIFDLIGLARRQGM